MRHRVVSLSIFQTAKVLALWYFLMVVVYVPFLMLMDVKSPRHERVGIFWIFVPILLAMAGFVIGALGSALYNYAASKAGGIELTLAPATEEAGVPHL